MIKIIFFDIDGTLLPLRIKTLTPSLTKALQRLQKKGIRLFLASGRPKFVLPHFEGVTFDGALTFNGQYCYDKERVLYENPLNPEDVNQIFENAQNMKKALVACHQDSMYCNDHEELLDEYFKIASQSIHKIDDFKTYLQSSIYQMMAAIPETQEESLLQGTKHIQIVRWWPYACDMIPKEGGKGKSVEGILKAYGLKKEEAMAFGDGGNDIDMLQAVGCSVAMGNALQEVKDCSDYITKSVEEDGVVYALKHFKLIEEDDK